MKNKQTIFAIAIMVLTVAIGFGITEMTNLTAYERFEKLMDLPPLVKSLRTETTAIGHIEIDSNEEFPPDIKNFLNQEISVKMLSETVFNPKNFQFKVSETLSLPNLSFEMSAFIDHDRVYVKYPLLGKPFLFALDDVKKYGDFKLPEDFLERIYKSIFRFNQFLTIATKENFSPEDVSYGPDFVFEKNGYKQNLKTLKFNLTVEKIFLIYGDAILAFLDDEDFNALIEETLSMNAPEELEAFKKEKEKIRKETRDFMNSNSEEKKEAFKEIEKALENSNFEISVGVNKMNQPMILLIDLNMRLPDEYSDSSVNMVFNIQQEFKEINTIEFLDFPEIDPKDTFRIEDFFPNKFKAFAPE